MLQLAFECQAGKNNARSILTRGILNRAELEDNREEDFFSIVFRRTNGTFRKSRGTRVNLNMSRENNVEILGRRFWKRFGLGKRERSGLDSGLFLNCFRKCRYRFNFKVILNSSIIFRHQALQVSISVDSSSCRQKVERLLERKSNLGDRGISLFSIFESWLIMRNVSRRYAPQFW
jgi:hypothetical protein